MDLKNPDTGVLYEYLDNSLELANTPFDPAISIEYSVDGRFVKVQPFKGTYIICPSGLEPVVVIAYKGKRKILEKTFQIVKRPDPVLLFFGSFDSIVSKAQILLNPRITLTIPESLYIHYRAIIYSCILEIKTKGEDPQRFFIQSGQLTSEARELVQRLRPGDKIHFTDIIFGGPPSFCPRGFGDKTITIR